MNSLLNYEEIEDIGELAIASYSKKTRRGSFRCVDIEGFLTEALKLKLVYETIAEDNPDKVAFLSDGKQKLWVKRGGKRIQVLYPKDTVVIDSYFLNEDMSAQLRFNMAHEAAHKLIELHVPARSTAHFHSELSAGSEIPVGEMHEIFSMIELYANRLAAVLLMPRSLVIRVLKDFNGGKLIRVYSTSIIPQSDKLAMLGMADTMGVSYTALFNRLKELKLLEYHDGEEYMEQLLEGK